MFETVTTNGATILAQLGLWSTLVWAATYIYMSRKAQDLQDRMDVLDWYIYEMEKEYGHIIDDYKQHVLDDYLAEFGSFYSDGEWVN
jgi:hypothetical protein